MTRFRLTPYVPTLFGNVEATIREALGLKSNVGIRHTPSRRENAQVIDFRVLLPNALELSLRLAAPHAIGNAWKTSPQLWLTTRRATHEPDPLTHPELGPCLTALGQLFSRAQKQRGPELASDLWRHYSKVSAFAELSDEFYCRVFEGVVGVTANLRLGFRCNQDCGLCWQGRRWPEPPAEMFWTWLDELGRGGIQQLTITGGEPTLHPALPGILRRARERFGMTTMLQTNAIQFRRPEFLRKIMDAGVERLFVSLHSADPDISDRMTRAPGTHHRTVEGIRSALAAGLRVGLNCVVERENYRSLPEHAAFIVENFVAPFSDNPVESVSYSRPQTYYDREQWRASLVPLDEIEPGLLLAIETLRGAGVILDITAGSCGLPACLLRSVPELIQLPEPDQTGMADPAFDAAVHAATACAPCALVRRCQGPGRGYFDTYADRGLHPFAEAPEMAAAVPVSSSS